MSLKTFNAQFKYFGVGLLMHLLIISSASRQTSQCILNVKNDKAYFHDRTTLNGKVSFTQTKAFLVFGDQVGINCQDENENWIYVSYKNSKGTITRGYIKKADLENEKSNNTSLIDFNNKINQKIKWEGSYIINSKNYIKDLKISIPDVNGEFEYEIFVASETCSYPYSGRAKIRSNTVAFGMVDEGDFDKSKITFNYIISKNMIEVKFDGGFRCLPDGIYKKSLKGIK